MATTATSSAAGQNAQQGFVYLPLIAGWLVPGGGHFVLRKWGRGALLAVSIVGMFALGLAMKGKIYTGAQDILDMLGLLGDLGNGLLFFGSRDIGAGRGSGAGDHRRLRHQVHCGGGAAERDCRGGRAQHPHGEEIGVIHPSHFSAVVLFALLASTVFGITMRETPRRMLRYGVYCFTLFVGSAIVLSWVMFLIAR